MRTIVSKTLHTLGLTLRVTVFVRLLILGSLMIEPAGAHSAVSPPDNSPLPSDPNQWVCPDSLAGAKPEEIQAWCAGHPNRGLPLPAFLTNPPPLSELRAKNAYDLQLEAFFKTEAYKTELKWISDATWRFTGPYVGEIGSGSSYGTHLPVRIYYSPEVVDWLCNGRQGELPDGAMIVKEMHLIDEQLNVTLDDQGCMVINADVAPQSWVPMLKNKRASHDGWYWMGFQREQLPFYPQERTDPPILGRSGFVSVGDFLAALHPVSPNPLWYPTGFWPTIPDKIPNVNFPVSNYGHFCTSCHTSAKKDFTFASINNILGKSLRYKLFSGDSATAGSDNTQVHVKVFADGDSSNPFTQPLPAPPTAFLTFYDQLKAVSFSKAWARRLPAQTYDHVVSAHDGPDSFLTSDQCIMCHELVNYLDSESNMTVQEQQNGTTRTINLSPYGEWGVSPMGLSGRDPIFFAQLQGETNNFPHLGECIEDTCLHCHGVMGQRQLAADTPGEAHPACKSFVGVEPPAKVPVGRPFRLAMVTQWPNSKPHTEQKYGALARDGVSCTVCHRISDQALGSESSFTGNFVTSPPTKVFGPYKNVIPKPMKNALGIKPEFGAQVSNSELCGSCHNILLPVLTNEGVQTGFSYEQATQLEWLNSDYAPGRPLAQSCQGCHMPTQYNGEELSFKIANFESSDYPPTANRLRDKDITLTDRDPYARHSLHGLNLFLNQTFQQFPLILGFRQGALFSRTSVPGYPALLLGQESMIDLAENQTARVEIRTLQRTRDGKLRAVVRVTNLTGHDFPSGVGFRRAFLEFLVQDADGRVLWASGRTNALGAILNGTTAEVLPSEQPVRFPNVPFQPHYQVITKEDQVQIYQELVKDSAGSLTTSFLRRFQEVKDNRIRPKGYDPRFYLSFQSPFIRALAETPGREKFDPYYTNPRLTGADEIAYQITLDPDTLKRADHVTVTLYNQSIPPFYLQERFQDAGRGPGERSEINRLYYLTSHLNVDDTKDTQGRQVLRGWKLFIASQTRTVPNVP
jgi:hypothetical protein